LVDERAVRLKQQIVEQDRLPEINQRTTHLFARLVKANARSRKARGTCQA
jgi:hypothetical protein